MHYREVDPEAHLRFLDDIAREDVAGLRRAHQSYGDSWKRRGGPGAYLVTIRKADRLELQVSKHGYDIFKAAEEDPRSEGVIDDIRDLRRYLLLIEAELRARKINPPHRDNS